VKLMAQFFMQDAAAIALSAQDIAVLDAYRSLGAKSACAADLYLFLRRSLKRDPRLPTIYTIIARLRDRGLLEDIGEAVAAEGGRPRRLYRLTSAGRSALALADRMSAYASGAGAPCPA
jgi:hypothetical protein